MEIVPSLNYHGACREALNLYEKAFGGHVNCLITYGQANDPDYADLLIGNKGEYIYHSELTIGNRLIFMCDLLTGEPLACHTSFLTMVFDTKEEVESAYAVMKEGSTTIYPIDKTAFSACRVAFIDKFGIRWGIMTERAE